MISQQEFSREALLIILYTTPGQRMRQCDLAREIDESARICEMDFSSIAQNMTHLLRSLQQRGFVTQLQVPTNPNYHRICSLTPSGRSAARKLML
jgi:DNA-binding MarR family transcriptional regulator